MRRRDFLRKTSVVSGTALSGFLTGCLGGGDGGGGSPYGAGGGTDGQDGSDGGDGTETGDNTVVMSGSVFKPIRLNVDPGDEVKWVNKDGYSHTVVATKFHDKAKEWNFSANFSGGDSTTRTFDEKGIYEYYCSVHGKSSMCGAVLVGDVSLDKELPCESGGDRY